MKSVSKIMSVALAGAMVLSMAACGNGSSNSTAGSGASNTTASKTADGTNLATMKLGTDNKDIKANLKFLTHRTDIANTKFAGYIKDFQKLYPNVSIKYEAVTNYADDVTTRMST